MVYRLHYKYDWSAGNSYVVDAAQFSQGLNKGIQI